MNLFNCINKVVEKVVAINFLQYYEDYSRLHLGQIGSRKKRSTINAVVTLVNIVQDKQEDKKLTALLFMNIKGTFDYISKEQLFTHIIELEVDGDFVTQMSCFLIDQKVELVINGYNNKEREIETGISQGSPISLILLLIYISGVFNKISETRLLVISLSFVNDLGYIASGNSVKEIVEAWEKITKKVIKQGKLNAIIYDTAKTETIFFSESHWQQFNKQLQEAKIVVSTEKNLFNKETMQQLSVQLDSQFKITFHINERVKKAQTAEIQIKELTRTYGLIPSLVRRIQLLVIQLTALYGVKLQQRGQKNDEYTIQQMINWQAHSIIEIYSSTFIYPLLCKVSLISASIFLNYRQR